MSKVVLNDVTSGFNVSTINSNFTKIEQALNEAVLYRNNPVGEPNAMSQDLDMNGRRIYNLPPPVNPSEPVRLQDLIGGSTGGAVDAKDVISYGAIGDGVVDDSDNIQKALDSALVLDFGGSTRNYKISKKLVVRSGAKLLFNGARMFQTSYQTPLFDASSTADVEIIGGVFTGVAMVSVAAGALIAGQKYSIISVGSTDFTAVGAVSNTPGQHFIATGAGGGSGVASTFYNRPSSKDICIIADSATNLTVAGNKFFRFAYSPLMVSLNGSQIKYLYNWVDGPGASVLNPLGVPDPQVPGFRNCTGVTILANGVDIVGNGFQNTSQGIIVGQLSKNVSIVHNKVYNTIVEHGMYIDTGVDNCTVSSNIVTNTKLNGIKFQWYDELGEAPRNLNISNNVIDQAGGDGIVVLNVNLSTVATLTGVTKASPGVFTTALAHGFAINDIISISGVVGMISVNDVYYVASTPTATTFTVKTVGGAISTLAYSDYVSGGSISKPKFLKGAVITGNVVTGIGQDGVSLRYVDGASVSLNEIKDCGRYGYSQLIGLNVSADDNDIVNTQFNGMFVHSPLTRGSWCNNTLVNVCTAGDDTAGSSSGVYLQGDGGGVFSSNNITGESTQTKMRYGLQLADGNKTRWCVYDNRIYDAQDGIISIHQNTLDSLERFDNNIGTSAAGPEAIVGLPQMLPSRGNPNMDWWGSTAPTTGFWVQGSKVWALYPAAGNSIGWVNVVSGTPGTWRQIGIIHAVSPTQALSGTYTPTGTATTNVSNITPGIALYSVNGDLCTVYGRGMVTPTASATNTTFTLSIPVPSSLGATVATTAFGVGSIAYSTVPMILRNNGGGGSPNTIAVSFLSTGTSAVEFIYNFQYKIQ